MLRLGPRRRLFLPFLLYGAALGSTLAVFPARWGEFAAWLTAYSVPPLGRETVVPALVARGFDPVLVVVYVVVLDALACLFILWNWHRVRSLPGVGRVLAKLETVAKGALERHPRLARMTFVSLMAYVAIPHQGGGGVGSGAIGMSLGYDARKIFVAVVAGSVAAAASLALASSAAVAAFGDGFWIAMALLMAVSFALIVTHRYRAEREARERETLREPTPVMPARVIGAENGPSATRMPWTGIWWRRAGPDAIAADDKTRPVPASPSIITALGSPSGSVATPLETPRGSDADVVLLCRTTDYYRGAQID